MSYKIRYCSSAKKEFKECTEVYPCMRGPLLLWLKELAEEATGKRHELSININDLLSDIVEDEKNFSPDSWDLTKERLKKLGIIKKAKSLLVFLRKRRLPWEFRGAIRVFPVLDAFHSEVTIYYEIDHLAKQLIVTQWEGLPGQ